MPCYPWVSFWSYTPRVQKFKWWSKKSDVQQAFDVQCSRMRIWGRVWEIGLCRKHGPLLRQAVASLGNSTTPLSTLFLVLQLSMATSESSNHYNSEYSSQSLPSTWLQPWALAGPNDRPHCSVDSMALVPTIFVGYGLKPASSCSAA